MENIIEINEFKEDDYESRETDTKSIETEMDSEKFLKTHSKLRFVCFWSKICCLYGINLSL